MLLSKLTAEIIRRNTKKYDDMRIAKQTPPAGVSVDVYDYLPDGDSMHKLNVYRPEEVSGKLPVIVNIHGGAWVYGDKDLNKYYCMYLASNGFLVMGMSYRLMTAVTLKEQVQDVFASMCFLADNAERLGADAEKVMLSGDSAGGHLASLAACIMRSPELAAVYGVKVPALSVKCLVMSHPVGQVHSVMLDKHLRPSRAGGAVQRIFDGILFGKERKKHEVYAHAAFTEYSAGLTLPPTLLIGCERDVYVRHSQLLSRLFEDMVGEGRCPRFVFDYVPAAEETPPRLQHRALRVAGVHARQRPFAGIFPRKHEKGRRGVSLRIPLRVVTGEACVFPSASADGFPRHLYAEKYFCRKSKVILMLA